MNRQIAGAEKVQRRGMGALQVEANPFELYGDVERDALVGKKKSGRLNIFIRDELRFPF
jgi:hypothetical protein